MFQIWFHTSHSLECHGCYHTFRFRFYNQHVGCCLTWASTRWWRHSLVLRLLLSGTHISRTANTVDSESPSQLSPLTVWHKIALIWPFPKIIALFSHKMAAIFDKKRGPFSGSYPFRPCLWETMILFGNFHLRSSLQITEGPAIYHKKVCACLGPRLLVI